MWWQILTLLQILLALSPGSYAEKMLRPKFKEIKTWSEEKWVSHKVTYDNADPHLNFSMEVHQELHDVDIHVEVRITNKLDPYYSSSLNSTINICRLLNYANKSPVGRFVHGFIREFGSIVENCPIAKGSYFINKFWWPEDPTIAILPEVEFDIRFEAQLLDANKKRTMLMNDHIHGDFIVQDVNNLKPGIFAMLPKNR
ncbi:uncharacterized protein LOC108599369 [Drosophila busckii]|uniref:uncharacterized protein LOC108599369 n=1 Tax=Drosophila busckii TaxID=30019 RepID=UPI00083F065C|nr:uncharacterized protein LOC108599369 [Drosophila busckii]